MRVLSLFAIIFSVEAVILLAGVRVLRFLACYMLFFADRRAGSKVFKAHGFDFAARRAGSKVFRLAPVICC